MKITQTEKIIEKQKEVQLLQLVQKKIRQINERKNLQKDKQSLATLEDQFNNL